MINGEGTNLNVFKNVSNLINFQSTITQNNSVFRLIFQEFICINPQFHFLILFENMNFDLMKIGKISEKHFLICYSLT